MRGVSVTGGTAGGLAGAALLAGRGGGGGRGAHAERAGGRHRRRRSRQERLHRRCTRYHVTRAAHGTPRGSSTLAIPLLMSIATLITFRVRYACNQLHIRFVELSQGLTQS